MKALVRHSWPGNIRELENLIERSVILSTGGVLCGSLAALSQTAQDRSEFSKAPAAATPQREEGSHILQTPHRTEGLNGGRTGAASLPSLRTLAENEREHISEVLQVTNGLIAGKGGAAEVLGLPASTLRSRMKKLGIKSNCRS